MDGYDWAIVGFILFIGFVVFMLIDGSSITPDEGEYYFFIECGGDGIVVSPNEDGIDAILSGYLNRSDCAVYMKIGVGPGYFPYEKCRERFFPEEPYGFFEKAELLAERGDIWESCPGTVIWGFRR